MRDDEEFLISYANFKCNLFSKQKDFLDPKKLEKFYSNIICFPICLPRNKIFLITKMLNIFQ